MKFKHTVLLKTLFFLFLLNTTFISFAQINPLLGIDSVYTESLRSVKLIASGAPYGLPVMPLKGGSFKLSFDDMDNDLKNYSYSIEQYDRDWKKPTKLDKMEYIDGFQEDRILNYKNASATNIAYVHYNLMFPNDNMRVMKSGNYILKVYLDDANRTLMMTKRFIVFENLVSPMVQLATPNPLLYNTHHEFDIFLEPKNFRISNPMNEIQLTVFQNRRWDNTINNVKPLYVQGERLVFDYQDSIAFLAGKEWRYVDLRSTRFRSERVNRIDKDDETWLFTLRPDLDRSREPYLIYPDLNGGYFIENTDFNNEDDSDSKADYVDVVFSLVHKQPRQDEDVYLFGELTNWKIDERFKMEFDVQNKAYEGIVQLKQGFYNYIYVTVPKSRKGYDGSSLEGDWYETQNEYTVLVYYRPFGARYDRVIGLSKYITNKK